MTRRVDQAAAFVDLLRPSLAVAAVSNVWLMVFISRSEDLAAHDQAPLGAVLAWTGLVALGLHIYASAINDLLDVRHDRLFNPHRPLARGLISPTGAGVAAVIALLAAVGASVALGLASTLVCLAAAGAILLYNGLGKHLPAVGLMLLGLIRAAVMFIPDPTIAFAWPAWLAMTHVIACSAMAYRLQHKRPTLHQPEVWLLTVGWVFWTLALFLWNSARGGDASPQIGWLGPALAAVVFGTFIWVRYGRRLQQPRPHRAAGVRLHWVAMVWLIAYDAAWCASLGLWGPMAVHASLFALAALGLRLLGRPAAHHTRRGLSTGAGHAAADASDVV